MIERRPRASCFVLKSGIPWGCFPSRWDARLGHDPLAQAAGVARGRGVGAAARGVARPLGPGRPARLLEGVLGLGERGRPRGGQKTGPNPTDRGKQGSKRHHVVDRRGVPLAVIHTAANVHDSEAPEEAIYTIAPIGRPRGRPRKRPEKPHAGKGYDFPRRRKAPRKRGIKSRIARRGVESSEKLGRWRWVVERTLSRLNRYRRLKVRYERRADVHQAFLDLGCALICWRYVQRFC